LKIKIHDLGDAPDSSVFRLGSGRKDYSYKDVVSQLWNQQGKSIEEAQETVQGLWEEARAQGDEEVGLAEFNDETKELFKYFRWYSDEKGAVSLYCKLSNNTETYVLSRNLLESAQAICLDDKEETIYDWMYRRYRKLVRSKQIAFYGAVLGSKKTFPSLKFYWEKCRGEETWKEDPEFRIPHTPLGISDSPEVPCFFYFDLKKLKKGKTPAWDGWLSQFPQQCVPIFKAWVYSIFDPKNMGRQAVWLHDNGYTGKSSVIQAINNYLGQDAAGSISGGSMKTNFAFEPLYGKRLVTYGDCKEPNLIRTPKIHSLLGNDFVTIDRKGLPAFTAKLHAKLIIASNIAPQIDFGANNERTRLLYIPLKEAPESVLKKYCQVDKHGKVKRYKDGSPIVKGGKLTEELTGEMDAFIYSCRESYQELCGTGQDIIVEEAYLDMMKVNCVSEETLRFQSLCHQFLEFKEGDIKCYVTHGNLLKFYNGATSGNAFRSSGKSDFSRFKKYLLDVYGIKQSKKKRGAFQVDIFLGVKLNDSGLDKADEWGDENE
jgi:hypothetical protein